MSQIFIMKSLNSNFNPLMKFSPSQLVTSSRPVHENSQSNSGFLNEKNSKNKMTLNSALTKKK